MLSVLEISRRRQKRQQTCPPGFLPTRRPETIVQSEPNDDLNNSSLVANVPHTHQSSMANIVEQTKKAVRVASPRASQTRLQQPISHMISALDIARRRAMNHVPPPGFTVPPVLQNKNNSAISHRRLESKDDNSFTLNLGIKGFSMRRACRNVRNDNSVLLTLNIDNFVLPCRKLVPRDNYSTEHHINNNNFTGHHLKNGNSIGLGHELNFSTNARLGLKLRRLVTPTCFQTVTDSTTDVTKQETNVKKLKRKKLRTIKADELLKCPCVVDVRQHSAEVAGETILVNVIRDITNTAENITEPEVYDTRLTPEHYDETYRYFERVSACRQEVLRAMYLAGDLLLRGVVDGDRDDWREYMQTTNDQIKMWREKCKKSNDYFAAHGKVLGQDPWSRFVRAVTRRWSRVEHGIITNSGELCDWLTSHAYALCRHIKCCLNKK